MLGFLSRFVDSNDREIHRIEPLVERINELEPDMEARSDAEIRALVDEIREEIGEAGEPEEPSDDERHHPELERRREIAKARRQREHVARGPGFYACVAFQKMAKGVYGA